MPLLLLQCEATLGEELVPNDVRVVVLDVQHKAGSPTICLSHLHQGFALYGGEVQDDSGPTPNGSTEHSVLHQLEGTVRRDDSIERHAILLLARLNSNLVGTQGGDRRHKRGTSKHPPLIVIAVGEDFLTNGIQLFEGQRTLQVLQVRLNELSDTRTNPNRGFAVGEVLVPLPEQGKVLQGLAVFHTPIPLNPCALLGVGPLLGTVHRTGNAERRLGNSHNVPKNIRLCSAPVGRGLSTLTRHITKYRKLYRVGGVRTREILCRPAPVTTHHLNLLITQVYFGDTHLLLHQASGGREGQVNDVTDMNTGNIRQGNLRGSIIKARGMDKNPIKRVFLKPTELNVLGRAHAHLTNDGGQGGRIRLQSHDHTTEVNGTSVDNNGIDLQCFQIRVYGTDINRHVLYLP